MAVKLNELKQAHIEAVANVTVQENALDTLLNAQSTAKASYRALLKQSADGNLKTDEDKKKLADAEAHAEGFEPRLSAQRKLVAVAKTDAAEADAALKVETERLAKEDAELAKRPSGRITVGAPNAEKDPSRGFHGHKDFLSTVMKAGMGMGVDERLKPLATQGSDEQQVAANPYGGYLVPVGVAPGILSVTAEEDPIDALTTKIPMGTPTVSFNARVDKDHSTSVSGGFRVYRRPETVDGTPSRAAFEQVTLVANEEMGIAFATERLLTDSPQSFVAIIGAGFKDEYAAAAMQERISGSGVGERQGVLNTPCLITVSKETGQPATTITKENIDKMAARSWRYGRAVWLANHNTRPQLKSIVQVVGTGGSAVPYFVQNGDSATLDGRPIYFSEFAKSVGTVGDLMLVMWSEYLAGTYESEQYAESIHVRFAAAERAFRFYRRNDGQFWWRSALTPKNGDTLSPCVVLATRA